MKILPFILFIVIITLLGFGLSWHPTQISSPLIDKSVPTFSLPNLLDKDKKVTNRNLVGHVTLLNVWATWCVGCAEEHNFLLTFIQHNDVVLYGLNYKDDPLAAKKWLKEHGNPYKMIAVDQTGNVAIDWGVYGTPETFLIDKKGIIRYKQVGPLTLKNWQEELSPLINKLQDEKA